MNNISVKVLNPEAVREAERMMVCAARLTQKGHKVKTMDDFMALYNKPYQESTVCKMASLPHPTIQKFGVINVAVVGASRRFLAQITRHQNEVKFMSASLQYSDYSSDAAFTIPYSVLAAGESTKQAYLDACKASMQAYANAVASGLDHDSAGYNAPQGLRNVLIISATPYQWKHMIRQRVCRRNTDETRIVMLKIWDALYALSPELFNPNTTGPSCVTDYCHERAFSCGHRIAWGQLLAVSETPGHAILRADYPALFKEDVECE